MEGTKKQEYQGAAALFLTAFIWGTTFVFQSTGMEYIGPLTFCMMRTLIAAAFLAVLWIVMQTLAGRKKKPGNFYSSIIPPAGSRAVTLKGGLICGVCLGFGMGLQQLGLERTTVGKTGFISVLYIIIVPLIRMAAGKQYRKGIWLCVLMALVGLFMLTVSGDTIIRTGDVLVFVSAIVFSVHILVVNFYSARVPGVLLSFLQMTVAALLNGLGTLVMEEPTAHGIAMAAGALLYAGFLSGGVAFTLQIVALKYVEPVVGSFIMCFESVFAVLSGWIILHEKMTVRQWAGCALMFAAIMLVQWMTNSGGQNKEELINEV